MTSYIKGRLQGSREIENFGTLVAATEAGHRGAAKYQIARFESTEKVYIGVKLEPHRRTGRGDSLLNNLNHTFRSNYRAKQKERLSMSVSILGVFLVTRQRITLSVFRQYSVPV